MINSAACWNCGCLVAPLAGNHYRCNCECEWEPLTDSLWELRQDVIARQFDDWERAYHVPAIDHGTKHVPSPA